MPLAAITTVPCPAAVVAVTVRLDPASLPSTVLVSGVCAGVVPVSLAATGVTLMFTVELDVVPKESVAM